MIMLELNKQIIEVVESNGFSLGIITKHPHVVEDEQYYVEINQNTPEGEDWWETIWFDGTNEGFIRGVRSRATIFDVDEEAEVYIEGRGVNGVPNSIIALVNDAKWKESALEKLADDLENINNKEEDTEEFSRDWNVDQLEKAIKEIDEIQARFYMDCIGNEVADILNEAQRKLKDIYLLETHEEE